MMTLPDDQYIQIDGQSIRYWQVGDKGSWLLLVHGIGACCEYWHKNIFELAEKYRVIALDLPGFGKSDKPFINYTLDFYSQFLSKFLDARGIEAVYLVGHSMGGGLALRFSIDHKFRVKKLIVLDNVGFSQQVIIFFRLMGLPLIGKLFVNINKKMFAKALKVNVFNPSVVTDELVDVLYPLAQSVGARRSVSQITRRETNLFGIKKSALKPLWDGYHQLKDLPILVLWGRNDELLKCVPHTAAAKKLLPHADVKIVDECGHILQLEHAKVFNQCVADFFGEM